jgi:hypothetical protein
MENRSGLIPLAVNPSAAARHIAPRSLTCAGAVYSWLLVICAVTVMVGCTNEGNPTQGATAGRADNNKALLEKYYGTNERNALRIRTDTARNRLWVLGLDDVRVFDTTKQQLMRKVVLPNRSVARFICPPDMVLDDSGSAIISSNVQARLWRIDADSFEVKQHEIRLQGREQWDTGFGALAFAADGALYALTSSAGSLWKIDLGKASAGMIKPDNPPSRACAFTAQFLKDLERSQ